MKSRFPSLFADPGIFNEIAKWPHPGFGPDGKRIFGLRGSTGEDDGVMPLYYRQRFHERIALQSVLRTKMTGGDLR
jgi:hypothetical protein